MNAKPMMPLALALAGAAASAQVAPDAGDSQSGNWSATLKPLVLDSASSQGTSLALDYDISRAFKFGRAGGTGVGSSTVSEEDVNVVISTGEGLLHARGTLASSKEKNPNKLLDFLGSVVYRRNAPSYFLRLGGLMTYETDQGFDNKQHSFGLTASVSKVGTFVPGDAGTLILSFGRVNPTSDAERKRVLGSLEGYRRWNFEGSYSIPVNKNKLRSIDLNYRHYQEVSAPAAIESVELDRTRLGLIRANLDQDFFLQYSRGSLPFDQRSERAVKVGWSMKLE